MFGLIKILTVLLALVGILQETAGAQNGRAGTDASPAILTIHVQVVPTVMSPAQTASQSNENISYLIPVPPMQLTVTEKKQLVDVAGAAGKVERRVVNVITVVTE